MDVPPPPAARLSPWTWFPEFLELRRKRFRAQFRLMGSAVLVGLVTGLAAVVFFIAFQVVQHFALDAAAGYRPAEAEGEPALTWLPETEQPFRWWVLLVVPAVGGLLSGLLVYTVAPEAEGHGTDSVIAAYHHHQGQVRTRVPLVKIVATAITIGTGGSGGQEGPITQIGGGSGSFVANLLRLRPAERRVLLAAGMGAGIAAIFRAPLAGALFAAEVLYFSPEFEPEVIIPAGIASAVAYCTFGLCFGKERGWRSLVKTPELVFNDPRQLGPYLVLALCMVVLAMLYTRTFYGVQHLFHRWRVPPHLKPAAGALGAGLTGVALYFLFGGNGHVLGVLSTGYGVLQDTLLQGTPEARAGITALVLAGVALGKIVTTSLTIGSGGSGGVFGPAMVIGGCGGGALGLAFHHWWPGLVPQPGSFVIVGMAGFFAAAAKTPFSALVIVGEMTGDYNLLLPTLWVCTLAFLLSDERSIYESQVESRSRSPAHQGDYAREVLTSIYLGRFFTPPKDIPSLQPGSRLPAIIERLTGAAHQALPVTDEGGRLLGVVSLEEAQMASQSPHLQPLVVATDLMRGDVTPLRLDDRLDRVAELFAETNLTALPVVDGTPERRVIGIVERNEVSRAYLRYVHGLSGAQDGTGSPL